MYVKEARLFLGLGLLLIPTVFVITAIQWLIVTGLDALGSVTGDLAGIFAYLALVVGATLTLLGLGLVMAATACALVELDAGRPVGPTRAYRLALRRIRPLLGAIAIFVAMWVVLTTTGFLIPVALWLAVRWALLAPVAELEDRTGRGALRRSAELVRGRWLRVGSLVVLGGLLALLAGPLLGALLIFVTNSSLVLLNVVAGDRLRDRAAVRRARHLLRVLRRPGAARARAAGAPGRARGGDLTRAIAGSARVTPDTMRSWPPAPAAHLHAAGAQADS